VTTPSAASASTSEFRRRRALHSPLAIAPACACFAHVSIPISDLSPLVRFSTRACVSLVLRAATGTPTAWAPSTPPSPLSAAPPNGVRCTGPQVFLTAPHHAPISAFGRAAWRLMAPPDHISPRFVLLSQRPLHCPVACFVTRQRSNRGFAIAMRQGCRKCRSLQSRKELPQPPALSCAVCHTEYAESLCHLLV
jgi:hypothetical protein